MSGTWNRRRGFTRLRPETTRPGLRRGFTLVELLIVIAIIGLLFIWLIVALAGAYQRSKIVNTEAFVSKLKVGCVAYRESFGSGRDYPPMDPVGSCSLNTTTDLSSQNLHKYLCSPVAVYKGFANVSAMQQLPGLGGAPEMQKPLMLIEDSRIDNRVLIDFWDRHILYFSGSPTSGDPFAGIAAHDQVNPGTGHHFDIVSDGPYLGGKDPDNKDCRVSTFKTKLEVE
jgi:prepilin-type N-terminal cleavage/methylation domain-containing protein